MKWKDTEFERQVRSESLIPCGHAIHAAQATVTRRRELSSSNREVDNSPGSADSLLRHVEITGDFDFSKPDHNDGDHFLACEIDSRVAALTYLERKKQGSAASKEQLEAQPANACRRIPTSCIVAVKIA